MKTTRNFNTVFDALYSMLDNDAWTYRSNGNAIPAINITEVESQYEMEFAVPGMTKEDFKIQLDTENNLVVSMEKAPKSTPENVICAKDFAHRHSVKALCYPMTSIAKASAHASRTASYTSCYPNSHPRL